ncbi:MAG: 3-oxoadipate CoA-transferase subunit A [Anaerolineales bacterium]|nr:3-oxoadipate CoA-transferase subunit A [Anaerolineales bacterium]
MSKLMTMQDAVAEFVHDGDSVAIEGFTHLICFAAGHEIIRQQKRNLELCRLTPDLIYDQMVAAGCARKLVFSWAGNPGVGSLHALRRAVEKGIPNPIEIEEYSHFGMVSRFVAGAAKLPFYPLRSYAGSDLPVANPRIKSLRSPYDENDEVYVVPPLNPDVSIIHVQRADEQGNAQMWGLVGVGKEAAFAADRLIIVAEDIVDESVIRADPNRTMIPGVIVDAVVHEPYSAHPSYTQGYYDRDNDFYLEYDGISRDQEKLEAWLDEWVYGVSGRVEYVEKLGEGKMAGLQPGEAYAEPLNYGSYR